MRFGIHLPIGEGFAETARLAQALGCQALQIFCGNPRGWHKPPLAPEPVAAFRAAVAQAELQPLVVHASYLINLAAPDEEIYRQSVAAFLHELERSAQLGAQYYVVHCGSHKGTGEEGGRQRIGMALRRAREEAPAVSILLENTAGTANSLGTTLGDLERLLAEAGGDAIGICWDTCHALAAGLDLRTAEGVARWADEFDRKLSLQRLRCLHINDSQGGLGSHLDRHAYIEEGEIGTCGWQAFFREPRLWHLPAILETPLDQPDDAWRNLRRAAELAERAGALSPASLALIPAQPVLTHAAAPNRGLVGWVCGAGPARTRVLPAPQA